jgi:hypothetical protein
MHLAASDSCSPSYKTRRKDLDRHCYIYGKPIEVEVEHKYNRYNITLDAKHGEPYHAKWFDGTNIALSTMTGNGGRRRTTRGSYGRTISRWQLNISVHVGADNHDKIIYTYDYIGF